MRYFYLVILIAVFAACSPYAKTNKVYKKQAKEYSKLLREYPVKDSAGLSYADTWVGTTNFSMRRPNYVVIIYTSLICCEHTQTKITLPITQLIAQ